MALNPTPGILYVTVQPKETLPLPQFHDWYNNEHGHLRVRIPFFVNGILYKSTDLDTSKKVPQKPEWLATYDVRDLKSLMEPAYISLGPNASPRETSIKSEIKIGRNIFELVSSREKEGFVHTEDSDFADVDGYEGRGRVLVAVGMRITSLEEAEEQLGLWYEDEHIALLMKIPGWLRTRRFKTSPLTPESPTEYVSLHEYDNINGLGGPEHQAAMNTPWRTIIREKYVASGWRRTYRTYYIFGSAPRDLTSLSQLPLSTIAANSTSHIPSPSWEDPSHQTRTWNSKTQPAIESFITTSDETSISYRFEGSPHPSAPTILFSNTHATNWTLWDPFLSTSLGKSLLQKYRILRYNSRGRNNVPLTLPLITLDIVTNDILTLLTHLRIPKLEYLIGVDLGGVATLHFSIKYPSKVKRFIACDCAITSSPTNTTDLDSRVEIVRGESVVERDSVDAPVTRVKALYAYDLNGHEYKVPGLLVVGSMDEELSQIMVGIAKETNQGLDVRVTKEVAYLSMTDRSEGFVNSVKGFLE